MSDRKREAEADMCKTVSQSRLSHALKYEIYIPVPDTEQPEPATNTLTMFHHGCEWVYVLDFYAKVSNVLERFLDTIDPSRKAQKTDLAAIKKRRNLRGRGLRLSRISASLIGLRLELSRNW
jgi:hypothetical protein